MYSIGCIPYIIYGGCFYFDEIDQKPKNYHKFFICKRDTNIIMNAPIIIVRENQ